MSTDDTENPTLPPSLEPIEEIPLPPEEEFPLNVECPQCKQPYRTDNLQTRVNTLLTATRLACPRCQRQLREMRLKDWYDHYVQGQTPDPVYDEPTIAPKMKGIPPPPPRPPQRNQQRRGPQQHPRQAQQPQRNFSGNQPRGNQPNGNQLNGAEPNGNQIAGPQGQRPPGGPGRRRRRGRRR